MQSVVEFAFAVGEEVGFRDNPRVTGEVLAAMIDQNGQHFEVRFQVFETVRRRWFNADALSTISAGPSKTSQGTS